MQIELITNVAKSERFAPNWTDRAWIIMVNAGGGSDGLSTSRQGDGTCLRIVGTDTYTDRNAQVSSVGFEALECETSNAPVALLLGAWHDVVDVGARGRIQCHGWDDDVLVDVDDASASSGLPVIAVTGLPSVFEDGAGATAPLHGYLGTIVELVANMADNTIGNHAVWWRP